MVRNTKFHILRYSLNDFAKVQGKLPKVQKRIIARIKALKIVERIHERISNKREDFVPKASLNLVRTYDLITFDDLNVKVMTKNHCQWRYS